VVWNRNPGGADDLGGGFTDEAGWAEGLPGANHGRRTAMTITRALQFAILLAAFAVGAAGPASGQACSKKGNDVTCDDGRRGIHTGDAIVWADGSQSRLASPHPSVIIGNKSSVVIGPGVFAGNGKGGYVPMDNPSAPNKARCPILDGVAYCF
jgi:hypothetical protein